MGYTAYLVVPEELKIRPAHDKVFMHHITEEFGVPKGTPKPSMPKEVMVVGLASDKYGQALVVSIDGVTERESGGTYHVTISCAKDKSPVYSNKLIAKGYEKIKPYSITVTPTTVEW